MPTRDGLNDCEHMLRTTTLDSFWARAPALLKIILIFLIGVLSGLGQSPFDLPILTLIGLGIVIWLDNKVALISHFKLGWTFGFGYFASTLAWITQPFLVDIWSTGWMAPFALTILSSGLALFWGIAFVIAGGRHPLLLCAMLALAEFFRTYFLGGFPWALLGYVWIETPIYHLAAFVGPHGMTMLTLLLSSSIAFTPIKYSGSLVLCILFLPFLPVIEGPRAAEDAGKVRLVHPNVDQSKKWDPKFKEAIYQRHLKLSKSDNRVNLIVWPETSLNYPIAAARNEISVAANGSHVIVGYQHRENNNSIYNSLGILSPDGSLSSEYHKSKLVPFGEYLPFGTFLKKIGLRGLATSDEGGFSNGTGPEVFWVPSIGNIQPLICYEGIFPQFVGRANDRPDLLVLISNDAWFGEGQGIAQHFAQARARTIELGLPMVRVANRGITTVIDARGAFSEALDFDDRGALDLRVPPPLPPTFYAAYGEVVFSLVLLFVICVWLIISFQKSLLTRY